MRPAAQPTLSNNKFAGLLKNWGFEFHGFGLERLRV